MRRLKAKKGDEIAAKHGVKMVGFWMVDSEHLTVAVLEAPNYEVFQAWSMEPEVRNMSNCGTTEAKVAMTMEEYIQSMMQAQ